MTYTQVLTGGVAYGWGNVTLVLFGIPIQGITKISYNRKQSKENLHGFGTEPILRGYSRVEYEASIELYKDEWFRILDNAGGDILNIGMFDIQVMYGTIPGVPSGVVLPKLDILHNCEFLEDPTTINEGDSKILCTIPLIIAGVEHSI